MRPTHDELIQINPRLRNRGPKELEVLIDAIERCGYRWDQVKKMFNNSQLGRGIRTEGLDIFTPEEFCQTHLEIEKQIIDYPEAERAKKLWAFWILKFLGLIILWGIFSWSIMGWRIWLFGLIILLVVLIFFYYYCSKCWSKRT